MLRLHPLVYAFAASREGPLLVWGHPDAGGDLQGKTVTGRGAEIHIDLSP